MLNKYSKTHKQSSTPLQEKPSNEDFINGSKFKKKKLNPNGKLSDRTKAAHFQET